MVLYFTSNVVTPPALIYMGKDKFENEDLIKHGFEQDVCLSSAHVYLRMAPGMTWDTIPQVLLDDLAQLTKANSIEGNKKNNVTIIYTPWANLKKSGDMDVGQVGFKKNNQVKRVHVPERFNEIINRLNKTKVEKFPDLGFEKSENLRLAAKAVREANAKKQQDEYNQVQLLKQKALEKNYGDLFGEADYRGTSNYRNMDHGDDAEAFEEDFM